MSRDHPVALPLLPLPLPRQWSGGASAGDKTREVPCRVLSKDLAGLAIVRRPADRAQEGGLHVSSARAVASSRDGLRTAPAYRAAPRNKELLEEVLSSFKDSKCVSRTALESQGSPEVQIPREAVAFIPGGLGPLSVAPGPAPHPMLPNLGLAVVGGSRRGPAGRQRGRNRAGEFSGSCERLVRCQGCESWPHRVAPCRTLGAPCPQRPHPSTEPQTGAGQRHELLAPGAGSTVPQAPLRPPPPPGEQRRACGTNPSAPRSLCAEPLTP